MAKIYYPAECPFCESPQVGGEGDIDGRYNGPGLKVNYQCGATSYYKYAEGSKSHIAIFAQGCPTVK